MIDNNLKNKPYFTAKDAEELGLSKRMLHYYFKKGELKRLARGVYRHESYLPSDQHFQWEDLAVAAQNIKDGVICLISALSYYDLTDAMMREFWIATSQPNSKAKFPMTKIVRMRNLTLGVDEIEIAGAKVKIFDPERTIVDSFRLLDRETAIKALRAYLQKQKKPNINKLTKYAKELGVDIEKYLLSFLT